VLAMPDFSKPFEMEVICGASIKIGAVLTQLDGQSPLKASD
jgi:hypothetical protein